VGRQKDAVSIKTVAFQNFPEGININRNTHDKKTNLDAQGDDYIAFSSPPLHAVASIPIHVKFIFRYRRREKFAAGTMISYSVHVTYRMITINFTVTNNIPSVTSKKCTIFVG
jgi:hypothetical protein